MRAVAGFLLGLFVALWIRTLRVRVVDRTAGHHDRGPWVLVFWHGTQVPLLAWRRRRRTAVLVSWSKDGELQSKVMARAGMHVVRGSSSRGGARGLASMIRAVRAGGLDAAFAVDGPKGPLGTVHPGARALAERASGALVPIGSAAAPATVLSRAWDRMSLPWPFARAVVVIGPPLPATSTPREIADAIDDVNATAARLLDHRTIAHETCPRVR